MNKHYRQRTPEQVQKKIDKLKTDFMVKKVMGGPSPIDLLKKMFQRAGRFRRKPYFRKHFEEKKDVRKVKRLERKLRRMENGKWRKGHEQMA